MTAGTIVVLLVIALLPALIAQRKGRSFWGFYVFGVLLWIVALPWAIFARDQRRRCPHCIKVVHPRASVCPHCQRDLVQREFAETKTAPAPPALSEPPAHNEPDQNAPIWTAGAPAQDAMLELPSAPPPSRARSLPRRALRTLATVFVPPLAARWGRRFGMTGALAAGAASGVLLLAAVIAIVDASSSDDEPSVASPAAASAQPATKKPKPKPKPQKPVPTRYNQLLNGMTPQAAAKPICGQYERAISEASGNAERWLASASGVDGPYTAYDFMGDHPAAWLEGGNARELERRVEAIAEKRLRAVARPKRQLTDSMTPKFIADSLFVCKLGVSYKDALEKLEAADDRGSEISTLAAERPWHPEGWNDHGDGLAWKWYEASCDYGYCWGIYVLSDSDCTNGLYAEVSIKDSSGVVIDYSNDTLGSLNAGETAKLEFRSFQDGAGTLTAFVTDLNCY